MTPQEKIEKMKKQKEQIEARIAKVIASESAKARKAETREKIILGGLMLTIGRRGTEEAKKLLATIEKADLRDQDRKSLERLVEELKALASQKPELALK